MQIVARPAILLRITRPPSGSQVLWIQADLYLADLNSEVAFRLHQNEQESLEWTGVRDLRSKGWSRMSSFRIWVKI